MQTVVVKAFDREIVEEGPRLEFRKRPSGAFVVALVIGTIELLQVFIGLLDLKGRFFDPIAGLDFGILGYVIVGIFLAAWGVSAFVWKFGRIEERYGHLHRLHTHEHAHSGALNHIHKHFH